MKLEAKQRLLASDTYHKSKDGVTVTGEVKNGIMVVKAKFNDDIADIMEDLRAQDKNTSPGDAAEMLKERTKLTDNLRKQVAAYIDLTGEAFKSLAQGSVEASTIDDAENVAQEAIPQIESSTDDPLSDGVAFDTLIDGEPSDNDPVVQEVTKDDGGVEKPAEQELLNDDIRPFSIQVG